MSKDNQKKPKRSAKNELRALKKTDLYQLAIHLLEITPEANRVVSKWINKKAKKAVLAEAREVVEKERINPNDELLMEYWDRVQSIRSVSNEPSLTPLQKQRIQQRMNIISELIKKKQVSTEAKFAFIDEMFSEYRQTKSEFGDILIDTLFNICKKDDDWEYLIKKLEEKAGRKENRLIMDIYRYHLKNTDQYLKKRVKHLYSGNDYWELTTFYKRRKKVKTAVETAEKGIAKGTGSLKELYGFLFNHYFSTKDITNLQRISQAMIKQGSKEPELLERLFRHNSSQKDYATAKDILLLWYESLRDGGHYDEYIRIKHYLKKMREHLKKADWKRIKPEFLEYVRQQNISDYLTFCWEKGMKKEIVAIILETQQMKHTDAQLLRLCDEFAEKLQDEFPGEIVEYYWQRVYKTVTRGKPQTIAKCIGYLKKAKKIYAGILKDEAAWERRFEDFHNDFKNHPSFPHEEMKGL
ncbi:MAG: hypothetical protein GTO45_15215 [Candidatus Aminicenantes bacterium]|nr:hypothetical protein [Candidatus Aminicenantes bacterium]NIN19456.1 hypothetical protein [Candidatus Aminicenantes bacterium]NIN43355.1 hypothetical protein [Candidatus Aminicenantes bacterium]NIN86100.1 hypothetical protein [Candidatus Aminicenantes bacterium]NIO82372.1 hypothetical protein [Candidatus Aminicenantes bacterium]